VRVTFAGAEVGELDAVSGNEHILGFDVSMEDAFGVNIVDGLEQFVHVELNLLRLQIFIADEALIKILLHQFEHERQFACVSQKIPVG